MMNETDCKSLIDSLPCGIAEFDLDGIIVFCNPRLEIMHECQPGETLCGMSIVDLLFDKSEKKTFLNFFEDLKEREKKFSGFYDSKNSTMAGNVIDVRINWNYRFDANGVHIGYVAICTDISDYKKACDDLKVSDLRYRQLFDTMLDGFALLRRDPLDINSLKVVSVNGVFEKYFQINNGDSKIQDIETLFKDSEVLNLVIANALKVFKSNESVSVDDFFYFNRYLNLLFYMPEEGYLAIIAKDNTQNRHLSEQLFQAQKMEALGTLAGGMAHDFNNVLTTILGFTEILRISLKDNKYHVKRLDKIKNAAKKASALIKQLLAVSRKQSVKQSEVNLNRVIVGMVEVLEPLMGENIDHILDLESELYGVKADQTHFEQMILNLSVNAKEAMPDGGTLKFKTYNIDVKELNSLEVERLSSNLDIPDSIKTCVCIEVSDTGRGIRAEQIGKIFDPFFTTKKSGTGLGLSVIYGIVTQHGGTIDVTSTYNEGASFRILFPASFIPEESVDSKEHGGVGPLGKGQTILVVEDNEGIKDFLQVALEEMGYRVEAASTGHEAHQIFNTIKAVNKKIDLLFSDVILPDVDGVELADEFSEECPDMKVLMCSGYGNETQGGKMIGAREYSFIKKPFELHELMQAIKNCLNS